MKKAVIVVFSLVFAAQASVAFNPPAGSGTPRPDQGSPNQGSGASRQPQKPPVVKTKTPTVKPLLDFKKKLPKRGAPELTRACSSR